jgi:hypothetical protein
MAAKFEFHQTALNQSGPRLGATSGGVVATGNTYPTIAPADAGADAVNCAATIVEG